MVEHTGGDWSQTVSGRKMFFLDPKSEDVCIGDIAHALSLQCRFGGHVPKFYCVSQHCCYVVDILDSICCDKETQFIGLMHDAAEAYLVDVPRPVKLRLPEYSRMESVLLRVIFRHFGIDVKDDQWKAVKYADEVCLRTEARDLMGDPEDWHWDPRVKAMTQKIEPISPEEAEAKFLEKFHELYFGSET